MGDFLGRIEDLVEQDFAAGYQLYSPVGMDHDIDFPSAQCIAWGATGLDDVALSLEGQHQVLG